MNCTNNNQEIYRTEVRQDLWKTRRKKPAMTNVQMNFNLLMTQKCWRLHTSLVMTENFNTTEAYVDVKSSSQRP